MSLTGSGCDEHSRRGRGECGTKGHKLGQPISFHGSAHLHVGPRGAVAEVDGDGQL